MSCFRGPWPPPKSAFVHEIADFCEIETLRQGTLSGRSVAQSLGLLGEEDSDEGIAESTWDESELAGVFSEIHDRKTRCASRYPFQVTNNGYTVTLDRSSLQTSAYHLYVYLLLATRFNMLASRTHADLDGTLVFERICAEVARAYMGSGAKCMLMGTARQGTFEDKVNQLCTALGEGGGADSSADGNMHTAKDGKVDLVAWRPFADNRPGKLIGMGQCKTGSSYDGTEAHLQPDAFFSKYCQRSPIAMVPFRMFFIAETFGDTPTPHDPDAKRWRELVRDAGIVFDRCRIMEFSTTLPGEVGDQVHTWVKAAAGRVGLDLAG